MASVKKNSSVSKANKANKASIWVDLRGLLHDLVSDGHLSQEDANVVSGLPRPAEKSNWHPLQILAEFGFTDRKNPAQVLDLGTLTQWFADKAGQPLY
ncbi:MAG TPA: hypothetical protein VIM85_00575, partial [Pseudomonadales bacterium]